MAHHVDEATLKPEKLHHTQGRNQVIGCLFLPLSTYQANETVQLSTMRKGMSVDDCIAARH